MKLKIIVSILALGLLAPMLRGDEPCYEFLQALRDRGYYDVALEYLDEMQDSPLSSRAFKATLPFEKAQTLIRSTSRVTDLELTEKRLAEAESLLAQSEARADSPELVARSQDYRGDLLFRRARIYLTLADNDRLTTDERSVYTTKAQGFLDQALATFSKAEASYRSLLDDDRINLRDPESTRNRKRLRGTFTVVRVKIPQILERYADTLDSNDPHRNEKLQAAAEQFEQLWGKYPNFPAGLDSCLYAARCNFKMANYDLAISFLQQLFNLPDSNALAVLKRRALALAADCWAEMEPYPFDDVIANLERYSTRLTRRQLRNSDWQRVQIELARAYRNKARDLVENDGDSGRVRVFNRDASKLIKAVARMPGQHRGLARRLLEKWNLKVDFEPTVDNKPIRNFADAKQQGLDLMNEIEAVHADVVAYRRQLARGDALDVQSTEALLEKTEKQLEAMAERCLNLFERALALADNSIARQDVNHIRYLQSICHYTLQHYFESALIGEFLVNRYPNVPFSRQAGGIAVRSCASLHDLADGEDKSFERERLNRLSQQIVDLWPGSEESTAASATLAKLILASKTVTMDEVRLAEKYVRQISDVSSERSLLNVKLGTKLWFLYKNANADAVEKAELEQRLNDSVKYLTSGLKSYDSGNLNIEAAWGALFLVEALLRSEQHETALNQLESAKVAPLDLVKLKSPVVFQSNNADLYVGETYKTAIKTYLAALENAPAERQWIDKSVGVVRAMRTRADRSGDDKAKQDVVVMYSVIATQMERQFNLLTEPDTRRQFADNLARFLDTIQSESDNPRTIIWAGRTLMNMADSFTAEGFAQDARPLYGLAITALQRAARSNIKDERLVAELKRQQALAKRGVGKFGEAYDELVALLKDSPSNWQAQMDAAATLQAWGMQSKTASHLAKALGGAERFRDPKTRRQRNLIWGWSRLSEAFKPNKQLKEQYYQSLYAAIETRLEFGLLEQKPQVVAAALKKLNITKARDADLGGDTWKPKFDQLEQRIRKNLNSSAAKAQGT